MSKDNSENLPSLNDFISKDNLPSLEDFIEKKELPSIQDLVEEEIVEEEIIEEEYPSIQEIVENNELPSVQDFLTETIQEVKEDKVEEEKSVSFEDLTEIVSLIEEVRKDIPNIPEIRYYDEELERVHDSICQVRESIPVVPEVRYYEDELEEVSNKIGEVRDYIDESISNLPEVRYYEEDIDKVRSEIPNLNWVKEAFDVVDENFTNIGDRIGTLKEKLNFNIDTLIEKLDVKNFENKVDIKTLSDKLEEEKSKIWEEFKNSSQKIWEYHNEFKDDDRKLKKQISSEYSKLKQSVQEQLEKYSQESIKTDELLLKYFNDLKEEITNLPEVKYYDEDLKNVGKEIKSVEKLVENKVSFLKTDFKTLKKELYDIVDQIKESQEELKENYLLNEPPEVEQKVGDKKDPLTPTGERFATFSDLEKHYRLFLNRIQVQLSTIGGGGAGSVKDLDDVSFDQTTGDGKLLIYDQTNSRWVGIASTALGSGGGSQTLDETLGLGNTSSLGMSVGVTTATKLHIDPVGSGFTYSEDLVVQGNARVTGILSIGTSSIVLDSNAKTIRGIEQIRIEPKEVDEKPIIIKQVRNQIVFRKTEIRDNNVEVEIDEEVSVGIGTTTSINTSGIITASSFVGDVKGNITGVAATFSGNVTIGGTLTYEDVTNIDSIGIITAQQDVIVNRNLFVSGITTLGASNGIGTVTIGTGSTALFVDGNARITGILTIGRSSVTIDGDNNVVSVGIVTISNSQIVLGENVTINSSATGINSAPNILYVAKDGVDSNNGTSIDNAKLTIGAAVSIAQTGTTIKVLSGTYNENNPIEVPDFVSIVGDNLKTVTVIPNNSTQDIFHVNKGTYLANMTFTGHTAPAAAVAFPPEGAPNTGGGKWESPYVQNCTSNTTTGTGMRIDGDRAESLKSMVVDSYTQYNQGGVGIAVTNNGYAQLVSVFTVCCNEGITVHKGGQCSLTNSNTDFGTYGLVADGVSDLQFTGTVNTEASVSTDTVSIGITTTTRPYEGQVVYFDTLYYTVETITITNGGSGYTSAPTVSITAPTGPNGITATAFATLNGGTVSEITIISSGNQYTSAPSVTISAPDSGVTATATANISPIYYTINSSTPISSGITTVTLDENLNNTVGVSSTAYFYQVSRISASSHTFEYVGSGNDITTATPLRGGVPVQENEIITRNGGKVVFTSTDQAGNFKIGNDITINQNTGTISGRAFSRSLFNQMTPFILALG